MPRSCLTFYLDGTAAWLFEDLGEEVHEEGVVPVAVGSSFVVAQDTDRLEADFGVAADCCGVVGGAGDPSPSTRGGGFFAR